MTLLILREHNERRVKQNDQVFRVGLEAARVPAAAGRGTVRPLDGGEGDGGLRAGLQVLRRRRWVLHLVEKRLKGEDLLKLYHQLRTRHLAYNYNRPD